MLGEKQHDLLAAVSCDLLIRFPVQASELLLSLNTQVVVPSSPYQNPNKPVRVLVKQNVPYWSYD